MKAKREGTQLQLLDRIAGYIQRSSEDLLGEVAKYFDLELIHNVCVPTAEVIERTGYTAFDLRSVTALPQAHHGEYLLVVADPAIVDRENYQRMGIPIRLASTQLIQSAWMRYIDRFDHINVDMDVCEMYRQYTATLGSVPPTPAA